MSNAIHSGRYEAMFANLSAKNEGAFVPFVMLGDPDKATALDIIRTLVNNGADALELGIPYSDPIADGPTIQQASIRALDSGVRPTDCLDIIATIREEYPSVPIGLLLYSNLVLARGINEFYAHASRAGVDSILIADVPLREVSAFMDVAKENNIQQILIAPPNASDDTLQQIGELSAGYTYLLGRAGVTGAEQAVEMPATELVSKLNQYQVAPPIIGFGISTPQQVSAAIEAGAKGAISGSATVNIIANNLTNKLVLLKNLAEFVSEMKQATKM